MKIRSITVFADVGFPPNRLLFEHLGIFARHARALLENEGFAVESLRMATEPFPSFLSAPQLPTAAQVLAIESHAQGFEYLSVGPALPDQLPDYALIPQLLAAAPQIFATGMLTTREGVSLPAVKACSQIIADLARQEKDGFANLRFCALANVPPYAPFFPAAYGAPGRPAFAFAIQGADLALAVFESAATLLQAREDLINQVESRAQHLAELGEKLAQIYNYEFKGIDFTLAPFPAELDSIARALEALGLPAFGLPGSLAACAFLTSTLDQAHFKRTGFNGLMLPVLEDSGIAARADDGSLSIQDLLMFSAVCGTGLDVIPLPGDSSAEALEPLLLDLAALALRLNKPLTARLMPIPDKQAGEMTTFSFDYFSNSRILPLRSQPLSGLLHSGSMLPIQPRGSS